MSKHKQAIYQAPYRLVHAWYHALVPYKTRIVFWAYRRRLQRSIKEYLQAQNQQLIHQAKQELRDILAQHQEAKGVVIFPPSVEWNTPLFQRPHQMAMAFASLGYLVLYWVRIDSIDAVKIFRDVADRLYLCNVSPSVLSLVERPIVFTYTHNATWTARLNNPVIIYELIDRLEIFNGFRLTTLQRYHQRLLNQATIVVGTANELVADLLPIRPDTLLCPNGVDMDHFAHPDDDGQALPEDIQTIVAEGKPIIGYYGALAEWFDYELVKFAAKRLPQYHFVLIGPDYDLTIGKSGINECSNIHWLGPKAYCQLPRYLRAFDVAIIPFQVTAAIQAVSPIKLFEYMAGGKPIVTTDLVECRKYPVVLIATTADEWVERLQQALLLGQDKQYQAALKATAQENTWQARAQTIIAALQAKQEPAPALAASASHGNGASIC